MPSNIAPLAFSPKAKSSFPKQPGWRFLARLFGLSEVRLLEASGRLQAAFPKLLFSLDRDFPYHELAFSVTEGPCPKEEELQNMTALFFQESCLSFRESDSLSGVLGVLLRERNESLATAESCTGGLIAKLATDVQGASLWFKEGFVTYQIAAKVARLGVKEDVIQESGVVSKEVALAMAEGARRLSQSDWAIGITGYMGPTGKDQTNALLGRVHIGLSGPWGSVHEQHDFPYERNENRIISAHAALDLLRRSLLGQRKESLGMDFS